MRRPTVASHHNLHNLMVRRKARHVQFGEQFPTLYFSPFGLQKVEALVEICRATAPSHLHENQSHEVVLHYPRVSCTIDERLHVLTNLAASLCQRSIASNPRPSFVEALLEENFHIVCPCVVMINCKLCDLRLEAAIRTANDHC